MIDLGNNPRAADLDGSILWVIDEYTHDEWFHTLTKLNKYCFLIHEETEYLDYLDPVARKQGAFCSNLKEFVEYYESHGLVVYEPSKWEKKEVFKLTDEGREKVREVISDEQEEALKSCLSEWDEMGNLNLMDEIHIHYPEYSL